VSRFGVLIHQGTCPRVEAWGELCLSTVPDLQACVLGVLAEGPGEPLVVDLRRVWFCDLAGLRSLLWLIDHGTTLGTKVELRGSDAIARMGRLVEQVHAAQTA
jgi:anti-anti-sigma regulatory factor